MIVYSILTFFSGSLEPQFVAGKLMGTLKTVFIKRNVYKSKNGCYQMILIQLTMLKVFVPY